MIFEVIHKVRIDFTAFLVIGDKKMSNLSLKDYNVHYVATGDGRNIDHGYIELVIRCFETWVFSPDAEYGFVGFSK